MSVYMRFKKNPNGLRQLVELLETTPAVRRKKMIDVGMEEDAFYTQKALEYVIQFEDIFTLSDLELTSLLSELPAKLIGYAFYDSDAGKKNRCLALVRPIVAQEIKEILETPNISPAQIGSAQLKITGQLRKMEKRGVLKYKRIPSL